jgi:hypothetical protein
LNYYHTKYGQKEVIKLKKRVDKGILEKEAVFWNGIKKVVVKDTVKRCHK